MHRRNSPQQIAEEDRLRSGHIQELVQGNISADVPSGSVEVPKRIIQFWNDLAALPDDVRECLQSWEPLTTQGFKRILFDDHGARDFISGRFGPRHVAAFDRCRHPAMRCDYFRLCYLYTHGGFYVDADEVYQGGDCEYLYRDNRLKMQPLCYDARTDTMVHTDDFIVKKNNSPDWTFYVNNNPLVAPPFPSSDSVSASALDSHSLEPNRHPARHTVHNWSWEPHGQLSPTLYRVRSRGEGPRLLAPD